MYYRPDDIVGGKAEIQGSAYWSKNRAGPGPLAKYVKLADQGARIIKPWKVVKNKD